MTFVATAILGGAALTGLSTAYAASQASKAQTAAAQTAANTSLGMYSTTRSDLSPYRDIGGVASSDLTSRLGELTSPISVNPQDFLNSDAYKFMQDQGEKAVAKSAAARGLGVSGAALKGSAAFESGLNSQFWQQNFNNQQTNQSNAYNRLKELVDTGENAGAQTGSAGTAAAGTAASAQMAAGNAQAAGLNAIGGAGAGLGNNIAGYGLYKGLYGGSGGGNSGPAGGGDGGYSGNV